MNWYFAIFERTYSYLVRVASKKELNVQEDRAVLLCFLMALPFLILVTASMILVMKNYGLQYRPRISIYEWGGFMLLLCGFNFFIFLRKKRYLELSSRAKSFEKKTLRKYNFIALVYWVGPLIFMYIVAAGP